MLIVDEAIFDYELNPDGFMSSSMMTPPQLPQHPGTCTIDPFMMVINVGAQFIRGPVL